jgi:hypothetical protein
MSIDAHINDITGSSYVASDKHQAQEWFRDEKRDQSKRAPTDREKRLDAINSLVHFCKNGELEEEEDCDFEPDEDDWEYESYRFDSDDEFEISQPDSAPFR